MLVLTIFAFGATVFAQPGRSKAAGAVFAMTNATEGNEIVTYARASDGTLTRLNNVEKTRGLGIGVDTDTQGPLRLSPDNRFLYAVNPGSDNVSVFEVNGTRLRFLQIIDAGDQPVSLTIHGNLLYVLDGSVARTGNSGFQNRARRNFDGAAEFVQDAQLADCRSGRD
jgi:6-phosphogluconolactonase (cycloisomerase 2 family)